MPSRRASRFISASGLACRTGTRSRHNLNPGCTSREHFAGVSWAQQEVAEEVLEIIKVHVHLVLGLEIFECRFKKSVSATAARPRGPRRPITQFWRVSRAIGKPCSLKHIYGFGLAIFFHSWINGVRSFGIRPTIAKQSASGENDCICWLIRLVFLEATAEHRRKCAEGTALSCKRVV